MLLLYLSLQHKGPGISHRFLLALELHGCFEQNLPHQLNGIEIHGILGYRCAYSVIGFCAKTGMLLSS